jgi:SAM-dependent methyltransferase
MPISPKALSNSERTIRSYEAFAKEYCELVSPVPPPDVDSALRRMLDGLRRGPLVLEIGSVSGRDADFIETLGAIVRRTDATQAFLDLQAARGKNGELLNVLADDLGGPYDAILAMCVLIHIDRYQTDVVLRKIAQALRPGGAFLVSVRDGDGETTTGYHTVYWRREAFASRLAAAHLYVDWDERDVGSDGDVWLRFLARRPAPKVVTAG